MDCSKLALLVLSACETGIIDMDNSSESLGLVTAFMQAGAKGVIASLWLVNDLSTALLMIQLYKYLRTMKPHQALLSAQKWLRNARKRDLLQLGQELSRLNVPEALSLFSGRDAEALWSMDDESTPYSNPFFWAPFVFNGTAGEQVQ